MFFDWLKRWLFPVKHSLQCLGHDLYSQALQRSVHFDIYHSSDQRKAWSLLLLNDGQDASRLKLKERLLKMDKGPEHIMCVAIHAGDRMAEYGTVEPKDYQGRGHQSQAYQDFIILELLPYLHRNYPISASPERVGIAGFSLGGLSAIDIAWRYPKIFGFAGIFSGSLWWRCKAFDPKDPDNDRVMHLIVQNSSRRKQRFWFQTGTEDETEDRNNNGIIDAIDDTVHLMNLIAEKIPEGEQFLTYHEVDKGRHEPETWGPAINHFLAWAFPMNK